MSHQVKIGGQYLSPERAAREQLPLDIRLVCPECEARDVMAAEPRTTARFGLEYKEGIPRAQDRKCLACGYRWTAILPPETYHVIAGLCR